MSYLQDLAQNTGGQILPWDPGVSQIYHAQDIHSVSAGLGSGGGTGEVIDYSQVHASDSLGQTFSQPSVVELQTTVEAVPTDKQGIGSWFSQVWKSVSGWLGDTFSGLWKNTISSINSVLVSLGEKVLATPWLMSAMDWLDATLAGSFVRLLTAGPDLFAQGLVRGNFVDMVYGLAQSILTFAGVAGGALLAGIALGGVGLLVKTMFPALSKIISKAASYIGLKKIVGKLASTYLPGIIVSAVTGVAAFVTGKSFDTGGENVADKTKKTATTRSSPVSSAKKTTATNKTPSKASTSSAHTDLSEKVSASKATQATRASSSDASKQTSASSPTKSATATKQTTTQQPKSAQSPTATTRTSVPASSPHTSSAQLSSSSQGRGSSGHGVGGGVPRLGMQDFLRLATDPGSSLDLSQLASGKVYLHMPDGSTVMTELPSSAIAEALGIAGVGTYAVTRDWRQLFNNFLYKTMKSQETSKQSGQTLAEYGLILALIAIVAIAAISQLGHKLTDKFQVASKCLDDTQVTSAGSMSSTSSSSADCN